MARSFKYFKAYKVQLVKTERMGKMASLVLREFKEQMAVCLFKPFGQTLPYKKPYKVVG